MPLTIHLGVVDQPYNQAPKKFARRGASSVSNSTTGDVAEILEAKYKVMETFVEIHGNDVIIPAFEEALQGGVDDLLSALAGSGDVRNVGGVLVESGAGTLNPNIFGTATGKIDQAFRKMLDDKELDGVVSGLPSAAAQRGVNHRLKRPYVKRAPRPSFVVTGLLQNSFRSWVS